MTIDASLLAPGKKLMDAVSNDGTDTTVYSDPFMPHGATVWALMLVGASVTTYSSTITLWATNKPDASLADDTDWVQMTATHGWDGFAGGDPSSASSLKELADVGVSGALMYRLKFVRSGGSADLTVWANAKDK